MTTTEQGSTAEVASGTSRSLRMSVWEPSSSGDLDVYPGTDAPVGATPSTVSHIPTRSTSFAPIPTARGRGIPSRSITLLLVVALFATAVAFVFQFGVGGWSSPWFWRPLVSRFIFSSVGSEVAGQHDTCDLISVQQQSGARLDGRQIGLRKGPPKWLGHAPLPATREQHANGAPSARDPAEKRGP